MRDEFDDIIDEIKKYFKLDSDNFKVDFLFIPESERNLGLRPENKKIKGFKISYHFETGMEKPEIQIEGDFDEHKIQEYLKDVDITKHPTLKKLLESSNIEEIDVSDLSLETNEYEEDLSNLEPHTEINDYKDFTEIILEIPGMSEEDVKIDFRRRYSKNIYLPFTILTENYDLEVKNGLAIIVVKKSEH
jgi:HSP20 family molecular chaperone IbpA